MYSELLSKRKPPDINAPLRAYQLCFPPRTIDDSGGSTKTPKVPLSEERWANNSFLQESAGENENEGICSLSDGGFFLLHPGIEAQSFPDTLASPCSAQVDTPEGHISVWYRVADMTHVCWRRAGCGWGSPTQPVPTEKCTERMSLASTDYWANHTAEVKTRVHNLNCLKQTSKQTIQPLVTVESRVQPWKTRTLANKCEHCMLWSPSCLCSW